MSSTLGELMNDHDHASTKERIIRLTDFGNNAKDQGCGEDANQIEANNRRLEKRKALELLVNQDNVDTKIKGARRKGT